MFQKRKLATKCVVPLFYIWQANVCPETVLLFRKNSGVIHNTRAREQLVHGRENCESPPIRPTVSHLALRSPSLSFGAACRMRRKK